MSYEMFRSSLVARISDKFPIALVRNVLQEIDIIANDYDFSRKCTDLIVSGGLPEPVVSYCASLAVENKALGTIDGYRRKLVALFESLNKPFNEVSTNDIRVFLYNQQKKRNLSKASVEQYRIAINAFYNWCVDEEIIGRNPARKITPIDVPDAEREPLSKVELEYLRQACKAPREKALIDFLYSTGCRISECAAVTMKDIDWNDMSVRIHHGKGDKFRIVYFNAEAEVSMKKYLETKGHESIALFSKTRAPHGRVTKEALESEVRAIGKRAGDKISVPVTPHVLRHTFATNAIENGMPVEMVQMLLGHANLDTTMIYVKNNQENLKASYRKYLA